LRPTAPGTVLHQTFERRWRSFSCSVPPGYLQEIDIRDRTSCYLLEMLSEWVTGCALRKHVGDH